MTTNTIFLRPKLTFAGRDAAVAAKESGVGLDLTHVQLGSAHYAISGAETALREPVSERIPFVAGDRPADGQLRLVAIWTENVGYQQVREMIFWAGDVPAYIWSTEEGAIAAVKTDGIPYVLFVDIGLNSEAESVVEIVVDPEANMALAALLAHEVADDAHPQYIRRDILPSELRMCRGEAVESEDPNNVRIELPEEVDLPHYAPGQRFTWKAVHTNTGPMTMDVAGLGAMPLQKAGTRDLEPADIEAGCMYDFYVDDDMQHFQLAVGVSNHGHADSASRLRTPRRINGVLFDGTADIVIEDDTKEPAISEGSTSQFWRGDKTWADLATAVRGVVLTGLSTAISSAVVATDTLLAALGKLQAQITSLGNNKLDKTATAAAAWQFPMQDLRSRSDLLGPPSSLWGKGTIIGLANGDELGIPGLVAGDHGVLELCGHWHSAAGHAGAAQRIFRGPNGRQFYQHQLPGVDQWSEWFETFNNGNLPTTSSPTDTTPGRLLRAGDGGWMGDVPTYIADLDDRSLRGWGYASHTHTANASSMPFAYAQVLTFGNTGDQIHQEAWEVAPPAEGEPTRTGRRAWRSTYGNKPWSAWDELISTKNIRLVAPSLDGDGATGTWGISVSGSAAWATSAGDAARANALALHGNMYCSFHWQAPGGQPQYLLGTTDGANGYLYNPADFSVAAAARAGTLNWAAYSGGPGIGNGSHLVFDASAGLSLDNAAIGNVDPQFAWQVGSPTLMGWNGGQTYGVRVDRARQAEQLVQNIILNGVALNAGSNVTLTPEQLGFLESVVGATGWTRLPNGWILQVGLVTESEHATDYRYFPTEFPRSVFGVFLQYDATGIDGFGANYGTVVQIVDRARFLLSVGGTFSGGGVCMFIAIGK